VTAATIEAQGIGKRFGVRWAVDGVDLRVERGEIYGLVGPSGAGKTTLIRLLCGLTPSTTGAARLLAHPIPAQRRVIERQVGYMPQEHAVYRDLTVAENLRFFGRIYGMPGRAVQAAAKPLLDLMGMSGLVRQRADQLSGGERQRLSLSCALLHDPELLLLDEPTIGLDPALRIRFWEHFHDLNARGRTILLSTHYLEEAGRCTRVGMMRQGRLVAEGTSDGLKARVAQGGRTPSMEEVFLALTQDATKETR